MKQDMPDISYERSMNHNYMILSKCDFFGKEGDKNVDFRTRMLLENKIPGLLPVTHRLVNGESRYYYEINSLQSLDRLYDKNEIRYEELKALLSGCVSLFDTLEEYLLDGTQIIMKPELIYMNVEKMEPYFVCYPDYQGDVRLSFMAFIDELLTKIDHTDERAVMLGYQVYRYTRNPNYVISEIGHMMEHMIVTMAHGEEQRRVVENSAEIGSRPFENGRESEVRCEDRNALNEAQFAYGNETECGDDTQGYDDEEHHSKRKSGNVGDLIGGIFCIFVSLCAGAIVLGARVIGVFRLSGKNELYLYGAIAMAVMAAVLFFICYIKKRKQDRELEALAEGNTTEMDEQFYSLAGENSMDCQNDMVEYSDSIFDNRQSKKEYTMQQSYYNKSRQPKACNETVCLGDGIVEERMLCGRINGREVNISLNKLPMTIGKLATLSDFVINDTAVSKMHARFEERDGRVCVCDLNSTNGTVRNGMLLGINQSVVLEPGDRLRFGRTCFTYC